MWPLPPKKTAENYQHHSTNPLQEQSSASSQHTPEAPFYILKTSPKQGYTVFQKVEKHLSLLEPWKHISWTLQVKLSL